MERNFIVDTGTTVSLVSDPDTLDDINLSHIIKIMGFNSSVSRSKERGTTFGFARSADERRVVPLRIPNVHHLPGAPHNLLSVSALTATGYVFHFEDKNSYVVTPEGETLELLQANGHYWLKWRRAVDPAAKKLGVATTTRSDDKVSARRGEHEAKAGEDRASFLKMIDRAQNVIPAGATSKCTHQGCERCYLARTGGPKAPLMLLHRRLAHWNSDLLEKVVKNRAIDVTLSDRARCVCDVCRVSKPTRRHVPCERGDYDEPPQGGAKEAYLDPMSTRRGNAPSTARSTQGDDPRPPQVVREGASRDRGPQGGHDQRQQDVSTDPPTRPGISPTRQISRSRQIRFADQPEVPGRRDAKPELKSF